MLKLYDLLAWSRAIDDTAARVKFENAVGKAARAQSCRSDLVLAQHCCEAFAQLDVSYSPMPLVHRQAAAHALLMQAVLLYARATSTGGGQGERGSVSIHERLPIELRDQHSHVLAVRDRVYAHVHTNESIGEHVWHREAVYAVVDGIYWQPAAATRRIQTDASLISTLRNLLPIADRLIRETFQRRLDKLAKLMQSDVKLLDNLEEFPFDAVDFFGSLDEATKALRGRRRGSSFGIIDRS